MPALLAVVYVAIVGTHFFGSPGGFSSLPDVALLFSNPWLLLAGWVHYLAFDLLIGTWETRDARERGVSHLVLVPCLVLTFLFGPAGWLLYQGLRAVAARPRSRTAQSIAWSYALDPRLFEQDTVSDLGVRGQQRSFRQLEHAEASLTGKSDTPWSKAGHGVDDASHGVQHDDVDRKSHEPGMNAPARHNQQAIAGVEMIARQQSHSALDPSLGDGDAASDEGAAVEIFSDERF